MTEAGIAFGKPMATEGRPKSEDSDGCWMSEDVFPLNDHVLTYSVKPACAGQV
jgi:hypothetical protein